MCPYVCQLKRISTKTLPHSRPVAYEQTSRNPRRVATESDTGQKEFTPRLLLGASLPLSSSGRGSNTSKQPELAKGQDNLLCQPFYIQHTQRQTPTPTINLRLASNPPRLTNSALARPPS